MLSEGFILINSEIAALVQSVTQLELFWERSGACVEVEWLEAEVVSRLISEFILSGLAFPPRLSDVYIHIFIHY